MPQLGMCDVVVEVMQLRAVGERAVEAPESVGDLSMPAARAGSVERLEAPRTATPPRMAHGGGAGIPIEVLWLPVVGQCAVVPADAVRGLTTSAAKPVQRLELPSRAIPPRMTQRRADRVGVEVLQLPVVDQGAVVGADVVRGLAASTAKPVQRLELPSRAIPPRMAQRTARVGIEVLQLPVVDECAVVGADVVGGLPQSSTRAGSIQRLDVPPT